MAENIHNQRPLLGGAISISFPTHFQDVCDMRQVPDHQVFVDPTRDESLVFELLDLKADVPDGGSAMWFLRDLANEQDADRTLAVSKGRQGREPQNIVKVYLANLRLKEVATDFLITGYKPMLINPLSESAAPVGAGLEVPPIQSGFMPVAEIFKVAVSNF